MQTWNELKAKERAPDIGQLIEDLVERSSKKGKDKDEEEEEKVNELKR